MRNSRGTCVSIGWDAFPIEQLSTDDLLRTLQRLHADLAEHVQDDGEPPQEAVAACVQL